MVNVKPFLLVCSVQLDSVGRQWLVLAATVDYHPMAKILLTNSHLVKQKVGLMMTTVQDCCHIIAYLCNCNAL